MKKINVLGIVLLIFCFAQGISAQNSSRDKNQQPERIMDSLQIHPGMIIGEAGAGRGYFTFYLAKRVGPEGVIYANDIDYGVLQEIKDRCRKDSIGNIITVEGQISDPRFPKNKLDMVVMMKAFHHFSKPVKWMGNVLSAMKPGALLVIIDTDPDKLGRADDHFYRKKKVLSIMEKTKFELIKIMDFLPEDNIYIYRPKASTQ